MNFWFPSIHFFGVWVPIHFDGRTALNCKTVLCPPPPRHLSFHLNQTLNINVIKKKKNPCPPLPLSCSSGIGWDVADFHLLHDLFPLKGMWLTKLYKQPLYFELPPTLINTFLSTGPTGYVPRQTSTWLGVVTGGDIDLFRHRYIFVS